MNFFLYTYKCTRSIYIFNDMCALAFSFVARRRCLFVRIEFAYYYYSLSVLFNRYYEYGNSDILADLALGDFRKAAHTTAASAAAASTVCTASSSSTTACTTSSSSSVATNGGNIACDTSSGIIATSVGGGDSGGGGGRSSSNYFTADCFHDLLPHFLVSPIIWKGSSSLVSS
eukprot:GHVS01030267.1.p1 GENE.GHVS01030267.1~~GHVS01030267.1.p1  ORF type:complete len:173 (+),score=54.52 GHVS01030267.1:68-586(+)